MRRRLIGLRGGHDQVIRVAQAVIRCDLPDQQHILIGLTDVAVSRLARRRTPASGRWRRGRSRNGRPRQPGAGRDRQARTSEIRPQRSRRQPCREDRPPPSASCPRQHRPALPDSQILVVGVGPAVAISLFRLVAVRTQDLDVLHADHGLQSAVRQLQVEAMLLIAVELDIGSKADCFHAYSLSAWDIVVTSPTPPPPRPGGRWCQGRGWAGLRRRS